MRWFSCFGNLDCSYVSLFVLNLYSRIILRYHGGVSRLSSFHPLVGFDHRSYHPYTFFSLYSPHCSSKILYQYILSPRAPNPRSHPTILSTPNCLGLIFFYPFPPPLSIKR